MNKGKKDVFSDLLKRYEYCVGICAGGEFFQVLFDFGIFMQLMLKQDNKGVMWIMRQQVFPLGLDFQKQSIYQTTDSYWINAFHI